MSETRQRREHADEQPARRKRSFLFRLIRALFFLTIVVGACAAGGVVWFLNDAQRTPREWAPYLERRAENHRSIIVDATDFVATYLERMDRLDRTAPIDAPVLVGARPERSSPLSGRVRTINSIQMLRDAMPLVQPGDVLLMQPGVYKMEGERPIIFSQSGTPNLPIVFRAARLGDVTIESTVIEGLKVSGANWRFENLVMRGGCGDHRYCEHAFHVVGGAQGLVFRNNRLEDFNAHFKINGEKGQFPDGGVIEYNTLIDTKPRVTRNPITPIDLVAASNWRISDNFIADFVREGPGATYGAFVKGTGERNVIERNVVMCEWKLTGVPGQRVGLSLGGGGTDPPLTRDEGRSGIEQTNSILRDNLIAFCSDVGIYVNKSRGSIVEHNTLIDTAGIDVRFKESTAEVKANLVDGFIRTRDGGTMKTDNNLSADLLGLFYGQHPQRLLYEDTGKLDLRWRTKPAALTTAAARKDLCGAPRPAQPLPGAFEDYAPCQTRR